MRIERKAHDRSGAKLLGEGPAHDRTFDGYSFVLHFFDRERRDVRVILERHEAHRLAQFIHDELDKQGNRVRDIARATQAALE